MKAIDRLKRDHKIIRSRLDVMESILDMSFASTWYILREMCWTLSRQLQNHIRREEKLVAMCHQVLSQKVIDHIKVEHINEPNILRAVNHLFIEEPEGAIEQVRTVLRDVILRLRQHMDEEEQELFPIISETLGDYEETSASQTVVQAGLQEDMTVNDVLVKYPRTRSVFQRLFVNIQLEGNDCLDEVAWRHGLESKDLLNWLADIIIATAVLPQYSNKYIFTQADPTIDVVNMRLWKEMYRFEDIGACD